MSAMDCSASKIHSSAWVPPRFQNHIRNQGSNSSSVSHDVMASGDLVPSPRRWSPTYQPRRSRQPPSSLSFIPSSVSPRPESHEQSASLPRRPIDRAPVCISPFRSVQRMKEPFQLVLPTSPASLDGVPPLSDKQSRSPKLPAGHTLRTWRSDQNLTAASMEAFGLLPSPPISDSRPASTEPPESYFDAKDCSQAETEDASQEADLSCENIAMEEKTKYIAYRPPGWEDTAQEQKRTDVKNIHEAHSNLVRRCESTEQPSPETDQQSSRSASSEVAQSEQESVPGSSPRIQRARTATISSEASWIPSNFSYCETWLKGVPAECWDDKDGLPPEFNRRKFQIVEQDRPMPKLDIIPGAKALDEPLRVAVASRMKPKLVDIARQSPSPIIPPPSLLPQTTPTTPDQRQEEVSAFSPDTPLNMSDSGYGTRDSGFSDDTFHDTKDDDSYTDPGSLTSDSVTSTVVCERPESAQGERDTSLQPEIRSGSVSPQASTPKAHSPEPVSNLSEKEEREKLWDHEWTLDQLDHSVKDFPRHMLRLTSPVIMFIRKNNEKALIRPFRKIFPDVAENLLDCLCAALIARNYLVSLSSIHRRKPSLSQRYDTYAVDAVPAKAYSTLGIQLPSRSPGRIKNRILGNRSIKLHRDLEKIVNNLLFAICGRADDTLKSAVEVLAQVLEANARL